MAIVFEQFDSVGSQAILDLWKFRSNVGVRRVLSNSPLVSMLSIQTFPYVALFQRNDQQALFMSQWVFFKNITNIACLDTTETSSKKFWIVFIPASN